MLFVHIKREKKKVKSEQYLINFADYEHFIVLSSDKEITGARSAPSIFIKVKKKKRNVAWILCTLRCRGKKKTLKSDQYLNNLSDYKQKNISCLIVSLYFRLTESAGVYPVLQHHVVLFGANRRY